MVTKRVCALFCVCNCLFSKKRFSFLNSNNKKSKENRVCVFAVFAFAGCVVGYLLLCERFENCKRVWVDK